MKLLQSLSSNGNPEYFYLSLLSAMVTHKVTQVKSVITYTGLSERQVSFVEKILKLAAFRDAIEAVAIAPRYDNDVLASQLLRFFAYRHVEDDCYITLGDVDMLVFNFKPVVSGMQSGVEWYVSAPNAVSDDEYAIQYTTARKLRWQEAVRRLYAELFSAILKRSPTSTWSLDQKFLKQLVDNGCFVAKEPRALTDFGILEGRVDRAHWVVPEDLTIIRDAHCLMPAFSDDNHLQLMALIRCFPEVPDRIVEFYRTVFLNSQLDVCNASPPIAEHIASMLSMPDEVAGIRMLEVNRIPVSRNPVVRKPESLDYCICSYAAGQHYEHKMKLLEKWLAIRSPHIPFHGYTGELTYPHDTHPYFFKIEIIERCRSLGYRKILWLDSVFYPTKDVQPLFDYIKKVGYLLIPSGNYWMDWCNDKALAALNLDRMEGTEQLEWSGGIVGFNFDSPEAAHLFDEWKSLGLQGLFLGDRFGAKGVVHRHDQSMLSYASHRRNQTRYLDFVMQHPVPGFTDRDIDASIYLISMGGPDLYDIHKDAQTKQVLNHLSQGSLEPYSLYEKVYDAVRRSHHWGTVGDIVIFGDCPAAVVSCVMVALQGETRKIWSFSTLAAAMGKGGQKSGSMSAQHSVTRWHAIVPAALDADRLSALRAPESRVTSTVVESGLDFDTFLAGLDAVSVLIVGWPRPESTLPDPAVLYEKVSRGGIVVFIDDGRLFSTVATEQSGYVPLIHAADNGKPQFWLK